MNMGEYITSEDVRALTDAEYTAFLNYVRFMGYEVWAAAVHKNRQFPNEVLLLEFDGGLRFVSEKWIPADFKRISLEEVKRMASMMNSV